MNGDDGKLPSRNPCIKRGGGSVHTLMYVAFDTRGTYSNRVQGFEDGGSGAMMSFMHHVVIGPDSRVREKEPALYFLSILSHL